MFEGCINVSAAHFDCSHNVVRCDMYKRATPEGPMNRKLASGVDKADRELVRLPSAG